MASYSQSQSSLMPEAQADYDDLEHALPDEMQEDEPEAEVEEAGLKASALATHANPALGAAAALLPHLKWLCACCAIPVASSAAEDAGAPVSAAAAAGGDAASGVTAIANLEQSVLGDEAGQGHSMAPVLSLLLKGERTSTAAAAPPASGSLTPPSSAAGGSSASSSSGGVAVSVPGVLSILRTLVQQNRLDPVRAALLALLLQVCQKHAGSLKPHLSALIQLCLYIVRAEKLGRLKEKAMDLLGFLLMLVHAHRLELSAQAEYTSPREIIAQLFREIKVSKSKLTQSMRGSLLSTLGLMSEISEEEFRRQPEITRELADMYGRALNDELESSREPHRKVIEGCLIGLKHFLMHHSDSYRPGHQLKVLRLEGLWKAVRIALAMSDTTKYDILRAGLACFSRHAALFKPFFTPKETAGSAAAAAQAAGPSEPEQVLTLLLAACKHPNITVSSRANYALEAFLQQTSAWLMEGMEAQVSPDGDSDAAAAAAVGAAAPSGTKRRLFQLVLSLFYKKLSDNSRSAAEVSLSVRALGQLARVVVAYMSAGELRKILARLLECSEKLFRAHTLDEVDRAVAHMPDFLAAFAFCIKELPSVDASVIAYLVALLRRFYLAYPTFTSTQRARSTVSLTRLFVVLHEKGQIFVQLLDKTLLPALVLTSSRLPELTDVQFFKQGRPQVSDRQGYIEYCYLFHNLLGVAVRQDEKGDKSLLGWNHGLEYPDESIVWSMRKVLFDHLMADVLKLMHTLDLSLVPIKTKEEEQRGGGAVAAAGAGAFASASASASAAAAASSSTASSAPAPSTQGDPSATFAPAVPKDFELFLNLIAFVQRFFFPPYAAGAGAVPPSEQRLLLNHHVSSKSKLRELVLPTTVSGSARSALFLPKWCLQWVALLVPEVIALANKHPLVSGFYKLLAVMGRIMEQFGYLEGIDLRAQGSAASASSIVLEEEKEEGEEEKSAVRVKEEGAVKMEDVDLSKGGDVAAPRRPPLDTVSNRRFVFQLLSDFLASVLVRIGQYSDELLYSTLHLLLSAPLQFQQLDAWTPALIKAIHIGKNYRPAAFLAVDVLDKWHSAAREQRAGGVGGMDIGSHSNIRFTSDDLARMLPSILPHLYDYLRLPAAASAAVDGDRKKGSARSAAVEKSELQLVTRILQFLGRVGGASRFLLGSDATGEGAAEGGDPAAPSATALAPPRWAPSHAIRYSLPLSQILTVYLDPLLPHLAHLAEFSTDRKTQVAACEALHSLIIWMIATTAQDPNRSADGGSGSSADESAFLALYERLFPVLLRLATSVEQVTKQLFHPLLFQIIHWFSNTHTTLYKDTRALLDAVTDAVGNEGNGALREYAAEAMGEFMRWAIKTSGAPPSSGRGAAAAAASSSAAASTAGSSVNVKALLRRLYSLALHPSPSKRLGAALCVNKFYRIFRESDWLIGHHALELLEHLLRSLRLADEDEEALGTRDELRSAIDALERIVTDPEARKTSLLLKTADRAGPAHCQSLSLFVGALLESAGSLEDDYRRESLRLFQSFCKVLPRAQHGLDAGVSFFRNYIDDVHSLAHFVAIVEQGESAANAPDNGDAGASAAVASSSAEGDSGRHEILPPSWVVSGEMDSGSLSDVHRWQSLQTWLTRLSSVLDVYHWLLNKGGLLDSAPEAASARLFGPEGGSELKDSLKHFLLLMAPSDAQAERSQSVDAWVAHYADTSSATSALSQKVKDTYAHLKCTALIRMFRLMSLELEAGGGAAAGAAPSPLRSLLGNAFYTLLFHCLLLPESMGFPSSHVKRVQLLQATIGHLCSSLSRHPSKRHIVEALTSTLQDPNVSPSSFQLSRMLKRVGFTGMVIEGYRQLWSSGLLAMAMGASECSEFAHTLLQHAFHLHTSIAGHEEERRVQLSPLGRNVALQMLQLAFHIGVSPAQLFACLTDQSPVELPASKFVAAARPAASSSPVARVKLESADAVDAVTTKVEVDGVSTAGLSRASLKGPTFYGHFRTLVDSYLAHRFTTFSAHLLGEAPKSRDMFTMLLNVADYIIQRRQRKTAVQHAFAPPALPAPAAPVSAGSSSGFAAVLSDVHAQAAAYVHHMLEGFSDACNVFMAERPSLSSGSSNASAASAGGAPSSRKQSARHRTAAASRDTSKLLHLPADAELAALLLQLLERLLILDAPSVLSAAANPSLPVMLDVYCTCLAPEANLTLKKKALSMLPAMLYAPVASAGAASSLASAAPSLLEAPPDMAPVLSALRQLISHPPFPPRSTDLLIGSPEFHDYTALLDLLLNALVLSKNFALLQLLLPILREGEQHTYRAQINVHLSNFLTAMVDSSMGERAHQVSQLLDACFELFMQQDLDTNPSCNVRDWLARYVLIPLLRLCALSSVRTFFASHAKSLFALVAAFPEGPKVSTPPSELVLQLMELEHAYNLLAIPYRRLEKGDAVFKESFPPHKDLIKFAHNHVKKCSSTDAVSFQSFLGAAYHALSATLMLTQTDPKFLHVLCFTEALPKGERLWEHLIDVKHLGSIKFEIHTNFPQVDASLADLHMLGRPVNMASSGGGGGAGAGGEGATGGAGLSRYLSSQYLSDSSVSQEAQGLFTDTFDGPLLQMQQEREEAEEKEAEEGVAVEDMEVDDLGGPGAASDQSGVVELVDLDPLLSIPAMPVLLNLVQFMDDRFGALHRDAQPLGDVTRMPEWMTQVFLKFDSPSTHPIIKWCIAKLLVLKPAVFQPYASQWFLPLVDLLLLKPEQSGAIGFHYFLRDVCSVFLRWRFVPGPDEPDRERASALLTHLMQVAIDHGQASEGKRSRLRANLLTIKLLIDLWQHRLTIDRRVIYAHLTSVIKGARAGSDVFTARQIGLQLLAIVIEKGFPGWDPVEDKGRLSEGQMMRALMDNVLCTYKTLYEPAAEVMGIWMRRLRAGEGGHRSADDNQMAQAATHMVQQALKKLFHDRQYAQFFAVLLKLSLYVGRFGLLETELLTLVFSVPALHGEFLHQFLQLLCLSSTTQGRGLYDRLKQPIRRAFLTVDSKAHELVLMLLFRLAGELSLADLRELIPDLAVLFPKHSSEACRMLFYKTLIWIYDNHEEFQPRKIAFLVASQSQASGSSGSSSRGSGSGKMKRGDDAAAASSSSSSFTVDASKSDPLVHLVVVCLLRGLSDPVASVREHLFEFFDDPSRLSRDVPERLLKLLTSLFHAETVELWLSYATRLMLYPLRASADWRRPFSDEPLEKTARFDVVHINASGYTRSQPMAPLFSGSSQQQSSGFSLSMNPTSAQQQQRLQADGDVTMDELGIEGGGGGAGGMLLNSQAAGANFAATPSLMSMSTQQLMDYNLSQSSQSEHLYYRASGAGGGASQLMGSYQPFAATPQQRALRKRLKGKNKRVSIKSAHRVQVGGESVALRFAGSGSSGSARSNANKFRQQADLTNRYKRVWEARLAEEQASSVTMYRQYRKGELPDIQITHRELLQPLESLHTDPGVAKQLFVTLFHAIYSQIHRNAEQSHRYRAEVREAVRTLLHRITPHMAASAAPLVFALQTAVLECGKDDAAFTSSWKGDDIKQLGDLAFHSKNFHSGVMLLEHILATSSSDGRKAGSKRQREEPRNNERHEQAYLQLARLYREMGENEIMMNLYRSFSHQSYTRDALSCMLRGDWSSAMSHYDDALTRFDAVSAGEAEWEGAPPSADEVELWSDERLDAMRQLTSWGALRDNVVAELDQQPDKLWEPQYRTKGDYLRHYLTSGLKVTEEVFLRISNAAAGDASSAAASSSSAGGAVEDPRTELLQFVERAFKDADKSALLQSHHAADLVLLYALNGLTDHAATFLRHTYVRFLQAWTDLPRVATGPRLALLQRLQKLTEVSEFLEVEQALAAVPAGTGASAVTAKKVDPSLAVHGLLSLSSTLQHQLSVWRTRLPSPSDSVENWDDIVLNRSAFLVHLKQSLEGRVGAMAPPQQQQLQPMVASVRADLSTAVVEMYRKAASVMLRQGNTSVADKYITAARQLLQAHGIVQSPAMHERDGQLRAQLDFLLSYSSIKVKLKHLLSVPLPCSSDDGSGASNDAVKRQRAKLAKSLHTLLQSANEADASLKRASKSLATQPDNAYRIPYLQATLGEHLAEHLLHDPSLGRLVDGKCHDEQLLECGDTLDVMAGHFKSMLADPSLSGAARASERPNVHRRAAKAFMAVVSFCDQRLAQSEEHRDSCESCKAQAGCIHPLRLQPELEAHLIEALVENVLSAMQLGSTDARGFFPRALELMGQVDGSSALRTRFKVETDRIPGWMFIQWIPQLLSVIALPQGSLVAPILLRIAKEYPQAVYYPFNLSLESIKAQPMPTDSAMARLHVQAQKHMTAIGVHLKNKLIQAFLEALEYLTAPEMKLKDLMSRLRSLIHEGKQQQAQMVWTRFRHAYLSTAGPPISKFAGKVFSDFSKSWRATLDQYFHNDGKPLLKMTIAASDSTSFRACAQAIQAKLDKFPGVSRDIGKYAIGSYTSWFSEFERHVSATREYIELPGQYTGLQRPQPELHVCMVTFDPIMLIMGSLRRPKRITIHGSDERSHNYLLKGGEDLRMDQRIEQVFMSMNDVLRGDTHASRRRLSLRTYQVIPFTSSLGMLEWVSNTAPLKALLLAPPLTPPDFERVAPSKYNSNLLSEYLQTPEGKKDPKKPGTAREVYYAYLKHVDRKKVLDAFLPIQSLLPHDMVARAITKLCATPESFLSFRSSFARSFATLSMCAYVLGLGDRHLENFLVDQSCGDVVGIDFGAAFGQGILLSVPELMPIRYTRQLQHMLAPLQTDSILAADMTYVMAALRKRKNKLLTVMQVFIKEPQMEWMINAKQTKHDAALDASDVAPVRGSVDWYPRRKLNVVRWKLAGHNPAKILSLELRENKMVAVDAKLMERCAAHLRGLEGHKRAQLERISTPEEQVEIILDMAKDPNILGRTWVGWGPFI